MRVDESGSGPATDDMKSAIESLPDGCRGDRGGVSVAQSTEAKRASEWTRKQKRGYQRIRSLLWFWQSHGFQVLWLMLSTAPGGDASQLTYRHKRLRQLAEKQLGYRGIEHYQVRTNEGHGVLHIFWAWRSEQGERARRFWIDQLWLSHEWDRIHRAPVVWVKAYKPGRKSRNRLSRYVISQYVQDQAGYVNMCWSWKRSLGFPLSAVWETLKKQWKSKNSWRVLQGEKEFPMVILLRTWENLLAGHAVWLGERIVQLVLGRGLVLSEP